MRQTFRDYYNLTKPGIIYSNVMAAVAGFLLASHFRFHVLTLLGVIFGIAFVIASACVFNNYIDRSIDKKMSRTKNRALVTGRINGVQARVYAIVLGVIGFVILALTTNFLTFCLGVIAIIFYVIIYGIAKRRSVHGTLVGTISGALPPIAGYTAIVGHFDVAALLLGLIWVFWQMPHFFAIAMYRSKDYANAGIPVLPVERGMVVAKRQIMTYIIGFTIVTLAMSFFGYTHVIYFVVMLIICAGWIQRGVKGFKQVDEAKWARGMFFYSLIVMLVLCLMLSVGAIIA